MQAYSATFPPVLSRSAHPQRTPPVRTHAHTHSATSVLTPPAHPLELTREHVPDPCLTPRARTHCPCSTSVKKRFYPCKTEHLQRSPLLSIGFNNFFYRGRATFFETFFGNFSAVSQKSTPVKCSVLPLLCYTGFRSSQGLSTNTLTTGVEQSR